MTPTHERWTRPNPTEHKWELRQAPGSDISGTIWFEDNHWFWSVPGAGFPKRGAKKVFREAVAAVEGAAK